MGLNPYHPTCTRFERSASLRFHPPTTIVPQKVICRRYILISNMSKNFWNFRSSISKILFFFDFFKKIASFLKSFFVPRTGFEPVTYDLEGHRSNPTELTGHIFYLIRLNITKNLKRLFFFSMYSRDFLTI